MDKFQAVIMATACKENSKEDKEDVSSGSITNSGSNSTHVDIKNVQHELTGALINTGSPTIPESIFNQPPIEAWTTAGDGWMVAKEEIILSDQAIIEKDEAVKEESEPTVVTVYVPFFDEPLYEIPKRALKIGEVPPNYVTKYDRAELVMTLVRRFSSGNNDLRMDLISRATQKFIDGEIDGLFEE